MSFDIVEGYPAAEEYNTLRREAGWHEIEASRALKAFDKSLFGCVAIENGATIGMGRLVGDGHIYFYVHDIIVDRRCRSRGIGSAILRAIMSHVDDAGPPKSGAFIGLMTEPHLVDFYQGFGFRNYPDDVPAMRIWRNGH